MTFAARSTLLPVILVLWSALSGCRTGDLAAAAGPYEGYLTEKHGSVTRQTRIAGNIDAQSQLSLAVQVRTLDGSQSWGYQVNASPRGAVTLTRSDTNQAIPLRSTADSCYINWGARDGASAETRVCFDGKEVVLDLRPAAAGSGPELTFILDRADPSNLPQLEPPADYKVTDLLLRSMNQSFSSQVEFEHVVQARLSSVNAHMNLLPHFTANTLMGFISFSWTGLIRSVGDLAPFVLPTRWYRAREAGFKSQAEYAGFVLMKADSANITEGLAYAISRDNRSIARMQANRESIAAIREQVYGRERLGLLPAGSTDEIDAVLIQIDKALLLLSQTVDHELTDLAQATGFFNPKAIRSIVIDTDASIDHPEPIDPQQIARVALERSWELKQMDALIQYARVNRQERYFNWLDPSGDSAGAIGFGFGSYMAIGASQIREMMARRQQLQSLLLQKVDNAAVELTQSVAARTLSQRSIQIQQSRVNRLLDQLRMGISISLYDLAGSLGDQMRADLDLVDAEFAYLVSRSKLMRLQYAGAYAQAEAKPAE